MMSSSPNIEKLLEQTFVVRAEYHAVLGSTNDRARQCAQEEADELPLLILAEQQMAGRGREGRRWWTGRGALAFSLLLDTDMVPPCNGASPLVALATAVAVVDALRPLLPHHSLGLHWPNDVVADNRKLAGILIEVLPRRKHIVGIGLNTNNSLADAPPELRKTAATLRELTGVCHDQTNILLEVLRHLEDTLRKLAVQPETVAERANAMCLQHGKRLTIRRGDQTTEGCCAGIAQDGALLLDTSDGRREFYSGSLRSRDSEAPQ